MSDDGSLWPARGPSGVDLDLSPLRSPVRAADVRAYAKVVRASSLSTAVWPVIGSSVAAVVSWGIVALFLGVFALGGLAAIIGVTMYALSGGMAQTVASVVGWSALVVVAFGGLAIAIIRRVLAREGPNLLIWRRWLRLQRFASANPSVTFVREVAEPPYEGLLFSVGSRRRAEDVIRTTRPVRYEYGNYRFAGPRFRNDVGASHGFIRIELEREVPHVLLIARRGRHRSPLPVEIIGRQFLSLEGDFDRHFTTYASEDFKRDALYILTPDPMALLIDEARDADVEFVDRAVFFYFRGPLDMLGIRSHARAARLVSVVGSKIRRRAAVYRGPHSAASAGKSIDQGGRRLRTRIPVVAGVAGLLLVGLQIFRFVGWLGERLPG